MLTNAAQNAVIGAVVIMPGADMPAMTTNQIRMVLKIAAAYGEELGLERAIEILSVVGTGFVLRALARQALDFVPGFGWALKAPSGSRAPIALGQVRHRATSRPERRSGLAVAKDLSSQLGKFDARFPRPHTGALASG